MEIPEWTPALKDNLAVILDGAMKNSNSSFYRDRFSKKTLPKGFPHSLEEWQTIPLMSREDISDIPFWRRVLVSRNDIYAVLYTGGTTARKALFTPRRTYGNYGVSGSKAGARRQLSFIFPWYLSEAGRRSSGLMHMNCHNPENDDDYHLVARLVKLLRADSLFAFPHVMLALASHLGRNGTIGNIRFLELAGERCSLSQRDTLLHLYNHPIIYQNYSGTEWRGTFGVPCSYTLEERSLAFHIRADHFFSEFVDPDSGEPSTHTTAAELVVTTLTPNQPFPLVRYRTGDALILDAPACPCGAGARFLSAGRAAFDRVRFMPYEFTVLSIEEAIAQLPDIAHEDFEAHYSEEKRKDGSLVPHLEIKVIPRRQPFDAENLAEKLSNVLKVDAQRTYAACSLRGVFAPLRVTLLTNPTRAPGGKRVRLIRDL